MEHSDGPMQLFQTADIKVFRQTPRLKSSAKSVTEPWGAMIIKRERVPEPL